MSLNILSLGMCKPSSVFQVYLVLGVNSSISHVALVKCSCMDMVYGSVIAIVYRLFKPMHSSLGTHFAPDSSFYTLVRAAAKRLYI